MTFINRMQRWDFILLLTAKKYEEHFYLGYNDAKLKRKANNLLKNSFIEKKKTFDDE